jgi:trans-2,3-dihydro-3-hydroxyanthranilate isomerase
VLTDGWTALTVAQGAEIGRPSRLDVEVRTEAGAAVETAVRGAVRMVAKGELLALP